MRPLICVLLALGAGAAAASAQRAGQPPGVLVLAGVTVLDGTGSEPRSGMWVTIRGGRIAAVTRGKGPIPPDATVLKLEGRWLLPGLVDAHVHLRDLASAHAALRAGVTTARSLGVDHFADIGLRDLHRAGDADVPDIIAAGYHVRRRLADAFFLDTPNLRPLTKGLAGTDDVRQVVRTLAQRGVDVVKVMATDRAGLPDGDFRRRVLTDEELQAAVAGASEAGLRVAAHAHTDGAALAAVRAGARSIEHGTLISESTLAVMRDRGACLVPTLTFWADMLEPGGEYDHPALAARAREMLPHARSAAARAAHMGVRVGAGSDMRYDGSSQLQVVDEIAQLAQAGLGPMGAIEAGTSVAAACLGVDGRTGAIKTGLEADLIVVDGSPLASLEALRAVVLVINNGRVAVDRRAR